MKHWEASQRNRALILGALVYTLIKAGIPKNLADAWLLALAPSLSGSMSALQTKLAQSALEGVGLITLILGAEMAILWWSARDLLGEWIYKSSSSNWGHVKLHIDKSEGRLRYDVDLFSSEEGLLHALRTGQLRHSIGHGVDLLSLHDNQSTRIWYHVPETRKDNDYYPERQGILTLERSKSPHSLLARWARIGSISTSIDVKGAGRSSEINKRDSANASGTFLFFERRSLYEARLAKEEAERTDTR